VKIRIERSGGLSGISRIYEINTDNIPPALETTANEIMDNVRHEPRFKSVSPGAADYYGYKIIITKGADQKIYECDQYNLDDKIKSLIKYVEKNSN
jgi:hypothetical protein